MSNKKRLTPVIFFKIISIMQESGKKNYVLFIVLILGIIGVTALSIWLGGKLANWFSSRHAPRQVVQEYTQEIDNYEKKLPATGEEKKQEPIKQKPGYLEPIPKEIIKENEKVQKVTDEGNVKKEEAEIQDKTKEDEIIESEEESEKEEEETNEKQELIEVEKSEERMEKGEIKKIEEKQDPTKQESEILYHIQLGIFKSKENAQKLKEELIKIGQDVYVGEIIEGSEKYYRVQIGAFRDKEKAEKLARDLRMKGYRVYISVEEK